MNVTEIIDFLGKHEGFNVFVWDIKLFITSLITICLTLFFIIYKWSVRLTEYGEEYGDVGHIFSSLGLNIVTLLGAALAISAGYVASVIYLLTLLGFIIMYIMNFDKYNYLIFSSLKDKYQFIKEKRKMKKKENRTLKEKYKQQLLHNFKNN